MYSYFNRSLADASDIRQGVHRGGRVEAGGTAGRGACAVSLMCLRLWHLLVLLYRYLVEKAEQQKLATVISAEGDAKAADLLADAFKVRRSLTTFS